jgi:apolipoprotein N-acyltransferase
MTPAGALRVLLATAAGAATVFGYAPFGLSGVPIITLSLLVAMWLHARPRSAAVVGFAFGLGLFGAGASWVYVALNTFGGMPMPVALIGTALWTAYLALYPALTGWLATRFTGVGSLWRALAVAALWTIAEWMRGTGYTGFPWLAQGYAQLPLVATGTGSPLAGYAPLGGVWLVTLAVMLCAGALALAVDAFATSAPRRGCALLIAIAVVAGGGCLPLAVAWTTPVGTPLTVSLVQGNVPQDTKFDPALRADTFRLYADLVAQSRGRLVVLPESAFPVFADDVPDPILHHLLRTATRRDGDVLAGMFTAEPPLPGRDEMRYYNSVVSLGAGDVQLYRKRHLVPFGETIPLEPIVGWFIRSVLAIPLADQSQGDPLQPPMAVAGQRVAVNICYEDAFGGEQRISAAAATLLVNVTNDAWYGHSLAAEQHNQIAAMRALETGRPLLRATNTGITSAIDHDGREFARLPWFVRGILDVEVTGRQGMTPYLRWGDAVALITAAALLLIALLAGWRNRRNPA